MRLQSFVLILRVKTCISINIKTPCNLIPDWFDCWLLPSTYETRSSLKLLFYSNSYLFTKVAAKVRVSTSVISKSSSQIKSIWGTYFLSQKKNSRKIRLRLSNFDFIFYLGNKCVSAMIHESILNSISHIEHKMCDTVCPVVFMDIKHSWCDHSAVCSGPLLHASRG